MTLPGRIRYAIPSCQLRLHSPLKRVNGSSQQLSDMCRSTSGFNHWLIRTCSTGKTINWQRQWQLEATPLPLVIFSLATAMTHFLPPQSYFLGLFPDGLIGSLLNDSGSHLLRTRLAPEQLAQLSNSSHVVEDAGGVISMPVRLHECSSLQQVGLLGQNREHFHSRVGT